MLNNPAITVTVINAVLSFFIIVGVYKNKVDNNINLSDQVRELENRITRLEEKINFLIENTKK